MSDTLFKYRESSGTPPKSLFREDVLDDLIDYDEVVRRYPWIVSEECDCVISPDSDGFLCGLLASSLLNWRIVGFYDGKVLVHKQGIHYREFVFLDCEINRPGVRSIGNHLLQYDGSASISNFNFDSCINPNLLRGFHGKGMFQRKYPFGTIHLLLSILQHGEKIDRLQPQSIAPLLFADGVGNNLFGYPENCLDWIRYLKIDRDFHILNGLLCGAGISIYDAMNYLNDFFVFRDKSNARGFYDGEKFVERGRKRSGHQLKLTNTKGEMLNLVNTGKTHRVHDNELGRVRGFIQELSAMVGWAYEESKWRCWDGLVVHKLQKGMLSDDKPRLNKSTYKDLFESGNPFSLAMTASTRMEYSICEHELDC